MDFLSVFDGLENRRPSRHNRRRRKGRNAGAFFHSGWRSSAQSGVPRQCHCSGHRSSPDLDTDDQGSPRRLRQVICVRQGMTSESRIRVIRSLGLVD